MVLGVNLLTPEHISFKTQLSNYVKQLDGIIASQQSIPEVAFITCGVLAHCLLLEGKNDSVIDLCTNYSELANSSGSYTFKYTNVVAIKYCAILGTAYEAIGKFDNAIQVYESAALIINDTIAASPEALLWAEQLYYRFSMLAVSHSWDNTRVTLAALRGYQRISDLLANTAGVKKYYSHANGLERRITILNSHFAYSSALIQHSAEQDIDPVIKQEVKNMSNRFEKMLFESAESAKSTDSNEPIEKFIETMMANWRGTMTFSKHLGTVYRQEDISETKKMLNLLRRATVKTFHSCSIARNLIFVLASLSQYDEALLAFKVYTDYQEKARIQKLKTEEARRSAQQNGTSNTIEPALLPSSGDDEKSVVKLFTKVIDILDKVKCDGAQAKATADTLRGWLGKNDMDNSELNGVAINSHSKTNTLTSITSTETSDSLAVVWSSISRAYCLFGFQARTVEEREHSFHLAAKSFETCISYVPTDSQVYADYGLFLARTSKTSEALEIVKKGLLVDNNNYACWHLMALLLVSLNKHDKALLAITNTISIVSQNQNELTAEERKCFLQMKMTQIAIFEAINGADKALEFIPEVFILFGELFAEAHDSVDTSNKSQPLTPKSPQKSGTTKSNAGDRNSSILSASHLSLRKFAPSSRFLKGHSRHGSLATTNTNLPVVQPISELSSKSPASLKRSATIKSAILPSTKKDGPAQKQFLSYIWLWAARLYRRAGLYNDCEESILESELLTGPTVASHIELGLLINKKRPLHALYEYESALDLDPTSLGTIVAMGQLILEHVRNNEKLKQKELERHRKIELAAERERMLDYSQGAVDLKNPFEEKSSKSENVRLANNSVVAAEMSNEKRVRYYDSDEESDDNEDDLDYEGGHFSSSYGFSSFNARFTGTNTNSENGNTTVEEKSPVTGISLTTRGKTSDILFISDTDERAAIARITQLLQTVTDTGYGFDSSEAWYVLSQFLEETGDKDAAINALWKSVGLEESRSVRSYSVSIWTV